jgi:hypothetical protein
MENESDITQRVLKCSEFSFRARERVCTHIYMHTRLQF